MSVKNKPLLLSILKSLKKGQVPVPGVMVLLTTPAGMLEQLN
jgi:hypothetical protein